MLSQAFFFLPTAGLFPMVDVVVLEHCPISPRRIAKTPRPMNGTYIIISLSDAFPDPFSSANIAVCNSPIQKTNQSEI